MAERVVRTTEGGVCTLTLDRPDKLNALDTAAFLALDAHLQAIEADETVACVVLRGAGKGFCAGADLGSVGPDETVRANFKPAVIERLAALPLPVVAAVHGVCFTGGLELALGCDFILADETARFADTHGKWGFVGLWGMSQRLPRRVGLAQAKRMMMTSRVLGAREALAIGLVDDLAPAGGLDERVAAFTGELVANSAFTNRAVKRLLLETEGLSLAEGLAYEHYHHPGSAPDVKARLAKFGAAKG
jgi:enoyl-CoA hydratase/carnithine racemase